VEPSAFTKVSALGVEEQRVWVVADLVSPAADRPSLGDGFRTELLFVVEEIEGATVVPIGALFRRSEAWQVFVKEGGVARLRTVRLRQRSGAFAAIAEGLSPGDVVILFPPNAVRDGGRVRPLAP
jgi:HlyD family secretion protein